MLRHVYKQTFETLQYILRTFSKRLFLSHFHSVTIKFSLAEAFVRAVITRWKVNTFFAYSNSTPLFSLNFTLLQLVNSRHFESSYFKILLVQTLNEKFRQICYYFTSRDTNSQMFVLFWLAYLLSYPRASLRMLNDQCRVDFVLLDNNRLEACF